MKTITIFRKPDIVGRKPAKQEDAYYSSQWRLMYQRLKKHKLARISLVILSLFYAAALFAQFLAPYGLQSYDSKYVNAPPMGLHFVNADGKFHLRPFVYELKSGRDPVTFRKIFVDDETIQYSLRFFVEGESYKFLGLIPTSTHLFGVEQPGRLFLFGTDGMGRDLFSRIVLGSQISLSIPLIGVAISFVLGLMIGASPAISAAGSTRSFNG
ncbi:D-ala-D-ala transporter subunit [Paenibacillus konkukensis]|uniref:D-ala-D-ala transporter subunit n=1 Tax=Paenibacillus konkukensis TaxID=2020716 RepID=A0ABY4RLA4_9BACL|nr:hypothetical protein [Paenibacillus konkukensis]UQZ82363.1 D-ala-D-ala transporter subunit [Paenibacillus konkukensis]